MVIISKVVFECYAVVYYAIKKQNGKAVPILLLYGTPPVSHRMSSFLARTTACFMPKQISSTFDEKSEKRYGHRGYDLIYIYVTDRNLTIGGYKCLILMSHLARDV